VTPAATPGLETRNPFAQLTRIDSSVNTRLDAAAKSGSPRSPPVRKGSHYGEYPNTRRVQRKHSRSSSRRSDREPLVMPENSGFHQPWHFEVNAHCNGGLRNALESVDGKLRHQLWVGTLGTQTDGFSEALKADIDSRMMKQCHSLPVWIPDAEFESCYDEFCHQVS
jgi:trehalose 6-phosphate synthase complex regulatory subunit